VALHFCQTYTKKKCQIEQQAVVRLLSLKGLKAKEIETELTRVCGDEKLQISAVKKR
jgi:hypothetical protein